MKSGDGLEDTIFFSSEFDNVILRKNFMGSLKILNIGRLCDDEELDTHLYGMQLTSEEIV